MGQGSLQGQRYIVSYGKTGQITRGVAFVSQLPLNRFQASAFPCRKPPLRIKTYACSYAASPGDPLTIELDNKKIAFGLFRERQPTGHVRCAQGACKIKRNYVRLFMVRRVLFFFSEGGFGCVSEEWALPGQ